MTTLMAATAGVSITAIFWSILQPKRRLARRVRPYIQIPKARLLRGADPHAYELATRTEPTISSFLSPVTDVLSRSFIRFAGGSDADRLANRLRQAGITPELTPQQRVAAFRTRTAMTTTALAVGLGLIGWRNGATVGMTVYAAGGVALGISLSRGRIDRAIRKRRRQVTAELYTVNQILAMRARAGGGATDALRYVAERTTGVIASEISEIMTLHRTGMPIDQALQRAADQSAEPEAARLYRSLAISHQRGSELGSTLLALARDIRNSRRDQAIATAASRRVAAVIPIVVILAPITIAFLAAPIPTLIFGS